MGLPFRHLVRRIGAIAIAAGVLTTVGASGALAFCFSNDSLSTGAFEVRQITKNVDKAKKLASKCFSKPTAECMGNTFWQSGVSVAKELGWEIIARGSFSQTVKPDQTKCCGWKDKGCNRAGKKDAKIVFLIQKKKYRTEKRKVKYQGLDTGLKYNAKIGDVEWGAVVEIGATDHMECRFDGLKYGCKNYKWPESPHRAHKKTATGMLIKSLHTGKCLEVGGGKKNNGANVNMWKCHGGKNQRWRVYKNGTIRSEMNWKCLDVETPTENVKNGLNVHMWDCHGKLNQRWRYGRDGKILTDGRSSNNMCLEVGGWKKNDGANVNIWKCGGKQANQGWRATKK